jgi:hypothetical protein
MMGLAFRHLIRTQEQAAFNHRNEAVAIPHPAFGSAMYVNLLAGRSFRPQELCNGGSAFAAASKR